MSDSLQEWTTYYQQLAEAGRFAAAVQAQPSLESAWNAAVTSAFAGGTVTNALDTLDSWIARAGYDTLSHMALDAVMPPAPRPGGIYGPWQERLSEIVVTHGALTFLQSMATDPGLATAFENQLTQYTITQLSLVPRSPDDDAASDDASIAESPDTELTYVTMLDARGTENIDAWLESQAVNVSPPPNIAQVTRALVEQTGADLTQWVGDYGNAATQLIGYDNEPPAGGQAATGTGPAIRVGGDASGLQLFLDGVLVRNVTWGAGPQAKWTSAGGNAVSGIANFAYVGDVDQGSITNRQIAGKFIVPRSAGNQYAGLSLTWPAGATSAEISFQATPAAGGSSGSWVPTVAGAFTLSALVLCVLLRCQPKWSQAARARSRLQGSANRVSPYKPGSSANGQLNDAGSDSDIELANRMAGRDDDLANIDNEGRAVIAQAGRNLQGGANDPGSADPTVDQGDNQEARDASRAAGGSATEPPIRRGADEG